MMEPIEDVESEDKKLIRLMKPAKGIWSILKSNHNRSNSHYLKKEWDRIMLGMGMDLKNESQRRKLKARWKNLVTTMRFEVDFMSGDVDDDYVPVFEYFDDMRFIIEEEDDAPEAQPNPTGNCTQAVRNKRGRQKVAEVNVTCQAANSNLAQVDNNTEDGGNQKSHDSVKSFLSSLISHAEAIPECLVLHCQGRLINAVQNYKTINPILYMNLQKMKNLDSVPPETYSSVNQVDASQFPAKTFNPVQNHERANSEQFYFHDGLPPPQQYSSSTQQSQYFPRPPALRSVPVPTNTMLQPISSGVINYSAGSYQQLPSYKYTEKPQLWTPVEYPCQNQNVYHVSTAGVEHEFDSYECMDNRAPSQSIEQQFTYNPQQHNIVETKSRADIHQPEDLNFQYPQEEPDKPDLKYMDYKKQVIPVTPIPRNCQPAQELEVIELD